VEKSAGDAGPDLVAGMIVRCNHTLAEVIALTDGPRVYVQEIATGYYYLEDKSALHLV
jgi:hypothetical protein